MPPAPDINSVPVEILAKILLSGMPTKYMSLVSKEWFMIVRHALFRRTIIPITLARGGITFLRAAVQPTISSIPGSALCNFISQMSIQLPPHRLGPRWTTLWQMFEVALPTLTRMEEITFYFRHKGMPMHAIVGLVPRFPLSLRTVRMSPVRDECYDMFASSGNGRLDPADHESMSLPWNMACWPSQLSSLRGVEHLILVTNMPVAWPPLRAREREVLREWTADLLSTRSALRTISILHLDDRQWYPKPRHVHSRGRYLSMMSADVAGTADMGDIISEEELLWLDVGGTWMTVYDKWAREAEEYVYTQADSPEWQ
ncbi:hypothetical protein HWV62_29304 [Athelia sp. TMB]|nr:hypothetical protein HWV62_29304 [Athelia sp. TMB]